jgi:hypothetical protein
MPHALLDWMLLALGVFATQVASQVFHPVPTLLLRQ